MTLIIYFYSYWYLKIYLIIYLEKFSENIIFDNNDTYISFNKIAFKKLYETSCEFNYVDLFPILNILVMKSKTGIGGEDFPIIKYSI